MLRDNKGFTLIEVVVVLVILGIMAAITIPNVGGWVKDANERKILAETKSAVKSAEGIIAKAYLKGQKPAESFTNVEVKNESALKGTVYGEEIKGDKGKELLHLSYTNYGDTVTYCAHPTSCLDSEHTERYNFVAGKTYPKEIEDEIKEPEDPDDGNSGSSSGGAIDQTGTMGGFYIMGQNSDVLYVKAYDINAVLEGNRATLNGNNPASGIYDFGANNFPCPVISINNKGKIEYYYVRNDPHFSWTLTNDEIISKIKNDSARFYLIDTNTTYLEKNSMENLKPGRIIYTDVKGDYGYYIYWPNTTWEPWNQPGCFVEIVYNLYPLPN